jgi:hypothetical protein
VQEDRRHILSVNTLSGWIRRKSHTSDETLTKKHDGFENYVKKKIKM